MKQSDKIIIYQVFPRWFGNKNTACVKNGNIHENGVGKFSVFTPDMLSAIKNMGISHIWYTGVIEHATQTDYAHHKIRSDHSAVVKGKAGSPYAIKDYYDIDPDLADNIPERMKEFEHLIRRSHASGLKVIIDFVPNHVARQYYSDARPAYITDLGQHDDTRKAFDRDNNFYYLPGQALSLYFKSLEEDYIYSEFPAKATGNDQFTATPSVNDWYETIKLNYGVDYMHEKTAHFDPIPDTWKKMLDILLFWASKGVDGFRCDMAEMVPVEFWHWVIPQVKRTYDKVCFIAEVYNPAEYERYIHIGKFDYLYDKVGLYDTLRAITCGIAPAYNITRCWQSVDGIQQHMLNFMENHDEQRIASDFFAGNPQKAIPAMIVASTMNTNPVMIYCGQELGERGMDEEGFSGLDGRTTIFDYWSVESIRNWVNEGKPSTKKLTPEQKELRAFYENLLQISSTEKAITQGEFFDLEYANLQNPMFNPEKQFAFLRKKGNEVLLVAVNFDPAEQTIHINIPQDAFHALGIGDNKAAELTDLFTKETTISTLTEVYPYKVTLPAFGGKILKFTYKD